jgi:uncharacterized protein
MAGVDQPLSDAEYARIAVMLERWSGKDAMNLEMLDGFFAALICGPDMVRPSEYLREIWGGDRVGGDGFRDEAEMQEFFDLIMRHWNSLARTFNSSEPFLPFLLEDDAGVAHANDWAQGFTRGMKLRQEGWAELLDDGEHGGLLVPILALAHEHDPDPTLRPYKEPMDAQRREQLVMGIAVCVPNIYRYFLSRRRSSTRAERDAGTHRRSSAKVGRNDPCPCGSGKKFKKCCGAVTVH